MHADRPCRGVQRPEHVTEVRLTTDEVNSLCPVTAQPDLSTVEISYIPDHWCVETKSLKLYLWGFRQRPVFAEALAAEIAGEIMTTAQPQRVTVTSAASSRRGSSRRPPRYVQR